MNDTAVNDRTGTVQARRWLGRASSGPARFAAAGPTLAERRKGKSYAMLVAREQHPAQSRARNFIAFIANLRVSLLLPACIAIVATWPAMADDNGQRSLATASTSSRMGTHARLAPSPAGDLCVDTTGVDSKPRHMCVATAGAEPRRESQAKLATTPAGAADKGNLLVATIDSRVYPQTQAKLATFNPMASANGAQCGDPTIADTNPGRQGSKATSVSTAGFGVGLRGHPTVADSNPGTPAWMPASPSDDAAIGQLPGRSSGADANPGTPAWLPTALSNDAATFQLPGSTTGAGSNGATPAWLPTVLSNAAPTGHLYVSSTGSDSNPGTQDKPLKSIGAADALARPGYVIHVAPGIYNVSAPALGSNGITTKKSGTAINRIKFVSDVEGGAKIVMSGTGIAWNSKGDYVDIEGFDVSGSGRMGLAGAGNYLTFRHNNIHGLTVSGGCNGSGGAGIDTYGSVGNVVIDGNIVRNIGSAMIGKCSTVQGIYIANANNLVSNNLVTRIASVGIHQWHGATASTIINNATFNNAAGILVGQGDAGATSVGSANNYVANNIVYDNTKYGIFESGKIGSNNRYENNQVTNSTINYRVRGPVSVPNASE